MDRLNDLRLSGDATMFQCRIKDWDVCSLASSLNNGKPCRRLGKRKYGSYNWCHTVVVPDADGDGDGDGDEADGQDHEGVDPAGEKWIIRFPSLPRLAYPVEKLRSEVATMKYIAERTTIPIPRVFAYGFGGDYPTGLPFIAMEYIEGDTLVHSLKDLDDERRIYLYRQLADIFIQLRQQEFPHVGALTLDDDDSWKFEHNRPLNIDFSDAQIDGQEVADVVPPNQTYASTFDYCKSLMTLEMINYLRQRDRVSDEDDAQTQLFSIHEFRDYLRDWIAPEYDHGPFVLTHGDFLPGNVMVDEKLRIVAIIDWEYSHTVPLQLFVPPTWLTAQPDLEAISQKEAVQYPEELRRLNDAVRETEQKWLALSPRHSFTQPLLSNLWKDVYQNSTFGIAHALRRRMYIPRVNYFHLYDRHHPTEEFDAVKDLLFDPAHNPNADILNRLVQRRVECGKNIDAILDDEEAWLRVTSLPATPLPPLSEEDKKILKMFVERFARDESSQSEGMIRFLSSYASIKSIFTSSVVRSRLIHNAGLLAAAACLCWILARR